MSQNAPPTPPVPPVDEEATPAEKKKFLKVIDEFLATDDAPPATPPPANQPPASGSAPSAQEIAGQVLRTLAFAESEKTEKARIAGIEAENKTLKANAAIPKKKRPWFSFLAGD